MKQFVLTMMMVFAFIVNAKAESPAPKAASSNEVVLTADNSVNFNEDFNGKSVSELIERVKQLDSALKSNYPIYLFLDTPGGSIQAGLELIQYLNSLNRPVHTVTLFAASMGFQLAQHLDQRLILDYGTLMSHRPRGGFQGEFGGTDQGSQIDSRYLMWMEMIDKMDKVTVAKTKGKQTLKSYRSAYENEMWVTGEKAVKLGYADKVVSARCDASLKGTTEQTFNFMGFEIALEFSKCPLNTYPVSISIKMETTGGKMTIQDFVNKGGRFGPECYQREYGDTRTTILCTLDTTLTPKGVNDVKTQFVNSNKTLKFLSGDRTSNVIKSY